MKILEGFKKRLKDIAESYERHSHGTEILFSAASLKAEKVPSTEEYLMPPVIVWDPLLVLTKATLLNLHCWYPRNGKMGFLTGTFRERYMVRTVWCC